jgi:hypothetical protein
MEKKREKRSFFSSSMLTKKSIKGEGRKKSVKDRKKERKRDITVCIIYINVKTTKKCITTNEIEKNLAMEQVCPAQLDQVVLLDEELELVLK